MSIGDSVSEASSSDRSLVALIRNGDEPAAVELYRRYAPRIFGLVKSKMSERLQLQVQPEDVVQSIFKSIFRGVAAGGYDAPAGGSLWQLMAVVSIHKVRRNGSRWSVQKRDLGRTSSLSEYSDLATMQTPSAEEFEVAVRELIEGLKPEEREVIRLRIQGYTVEEIGLQTERSRRSVERLLHSARVKLSNMLDDGGLEDE